MLGAVGLNVNVFASRSASAGSLYAFALRAYGSRGALFIGWCQMWAYVFVAVASACAFAVFVPALLGPLHLNVPNVVATLGCVAIVSPWNYPLLLTVSPLVDAIAAVTGADAAALVRYAPNPTVQAQFGSYPPIATAIADRLGFAHDGDPATLVRNALAAAAEG